MSSDVQRSTSRLVDLEEIEIAEWVHFVNEWRMALADAEAEAAGAREVPR